MKLASVVTVALAVVLAVVVQISVLSPLSWRGVVPNLVLLIVISAALARGATFAMVLGFGAGLLLDLAPPADHLIGRWALALVLVGYVASRVRSDHKLKLVSVLGTAAAASFIGTSVFALSGLILADAPLSVAAILPVIAVSVLIDLALTPVVVPLMIRLLGHRPEQNRRRPVISPAEEGSVVVGAIR